VLFVVNLLHFFGKLHWQPRHFNRALRLHETLAKLKLGEELRKQEFNSALRKADEEIAKQKRELKAKQAKAAAKAVDPARLVTLSELTQLSAHVSC